MLIDEGAQALVVITSLRGMLLKAAEELLLARELPSLNQQPLLVQHVGGPLLVAFHTCRRSKASSGSGSTQLHRWHSDGALLQHLKPKPRPRYAPKSYIYVDTLCSEKSPLPSDSAYFTTSESKAKLLTRLRGSSNIMEAAQPFQDHHQLNKRKEELVKSIGRKLEILRAEQEAIKEEQKLNHELGAEVTILVVKRASNPQSDKYKLHVEEIDKITSLLLGLSGRLARAENALRTLSSETDPEEKRILESKRDKLSEQLEEAKRLKENIDRRAVQVSKVLNQYLSEDEYADYDHFIKMKAKLIMDAREIDDKIKLGDEQQIALKEMFISCQKT